MLRSIIPNSSAVLERSVEKRQCTFKVLSSKTPATMFVFPTSTTSNILSSSSEICVPFAKYGIKAFFILPQSGNIARRNCSYLTLTVLRVLIPLSLRRTDRNITGNNLFFAAVLAAYNQQAFFINILGRTEISHIRGNNLYLLT